MKVNNEISHIIKTVRPGWLSRSACEHSDKPCKHFKRGNCHRLSIVLNLMCMNLSCEYCLIHNLMYEAAWRTDQQFEVFISAFCWKSIGTHCGRIFQCCGARLVLWWMGYKRTAVGMPEMPVCWVFTDYWKIWFF